MKKAAAAVSRGKAKPLDVFTSYLFILPVILGILLFTLVPMVSSLYYSFMHYTVIQSHPSGFAGLENFVKAFTSDWLTVGNSLWNTFVYAFISLPLSIVLSFGVALLLVRKMPGIRVFRTLIYLPVLIPAVVSSLLWGDILDYNMGVVNMMLQTIGLPKFGFFSQESTALPTFIFIGLFGLGGSMVLWIAQMQAIPETMLESARIEGAGYGTQLIKIIVPMCTPMIFYNLVLGIIGALQVFGTAFMLMEPANGNALNFFVVKIYGEAFLAFDMGYACALSWILFVIIGVLSAVVFKTSGWVYYGEAQ